MNQSQYGRASGSYPPPNQGTQTSQGSQGYPPPGNSYPSGPYSPHHGGHYPPASNQYANDQYSPHQVVQGAGSVGQYPPQNPAGQYPPPSNQYPGSQYPPSSGVPPPGAGYPPPGAQYSNQYPPSGRGGQPSGQSSGYIQGGYGGGSQQYGSAQQQWYSTFYNQLSPQEIQNLQQWFRRVDEDGSGSITPNELMKLTFGGVPIDWDTAWKLVRIFDQDRNGTIDFYEYATLHRFIMAIQGAFVAGDRDRSGVLDEREIFDSLRATGFNLSPESVRVFFFKYSRTTGGRGLTFPLFLKMAADIAILRSSFEWEDSQRTGRITLDFNKLLMISGGL